VVVYLWPGSKLAGAAPGDGFTVALGTGDGDPEQVLAAAVECVDLLPGGTVLTALAPTAALGRTYVGRSWRETTLGQVVHDLLDEGGVDAGTIDADLTLPALHVDPHRSVWSALHDLARRTGHEITTTSDGAVSFSPAPGATSGGGLGGLAGAVASAASSLLGLGSTSLREGAELLAAARTTRTAPPAAGPAGARVNPASTASWAIPQAAPDDGSGVVVLDPALRTREAADAATNAFAKAAARRGTTARLRIPGRPGLRPGGSVDVEAGDATTTYRLLAVRHTLDAAAGYLCAIVAEAAS